MIACQIFEKVELPGRKIDALPFPIDGPSDRVNFKRGNGQYNRRLRLIAAKKGTNARTQLCKRERLYQIVVGTRIEPYDTVLYCVFCSQDKNRCRRALLPQQ